VTLGDPRGIGPEVARAALAADGPRRRAEFVVVGPAADEVEGADRAVDVGRWDPDADDPEALAGRLAGRAVEAAADLALDGEVDGIVTAPLSKRALSAAGYPWPGHTEWLRDLSGAEEVTMMMTAEETPLGGPLRMGLLTGHVALREVPSTLTRRLALRRARLAVRALRDWWAIDRPRVAFAGVNPHASEDGLFGDEEERVLAPVARRVSEDGEAEVDGIHPADTVFRRCLDGTVDAVLVPYHDVGLAVLKTLAFETGVNVTAGLPFPRTSPGHGTALDIAGRGEADPRSMTEAVRLCVRFCGARRPAAAGGRRAR
jgi:4-hydroxythreonine-4-phosphate dehydrogenase